MRGLLMEVLLIRASIETGFPLRCVCSEPWGLGSGLSAQGCGQARVPQVPQALHLVRAGENSRQTHPVLRTRGSKEPDASPNAAQISLQNANKALPLFCSGDTAGKTRVAREAWEDPQADCCSSAATETTRPSAISPLPTARLQSSRSWSCGALWGLHFDSSRVSLRKTVKLEWNTWLKYPDKSWWSSKLLLFRWFRATLGCVPLPWNTINHASIEKPTHQSVSFLTDILIYKCIYVL